jgi:RNA polymerase sigma-70 factor (ECF subfamily)
VRPWLVRVAVNLARDQLRRRRVRGYEGPWLPSPVETGPGSIEHDHAATEPLPDARYSLRESATFAFLLALETLTPHQRAALILRDVLDYSVRETAAALGTTEASVKQTHRRARLAMEGYDEARGTVAPTPEVIARTRAALERFLQAVASGDSAGAEAALADDVRALSSSPRASP